MGIAILRGHPPTPQVQPSRCLPYPSRTSWHGWLLVLKLVFAVKTAAGLVLETRESPVANPPGQMSRLEKLAIWNPDILTRATLRRPVT